MDTKSNDDSAGSDSLDKSMQIKCVMVETTGSVSGEAGASSSSSEELDSCSRDSAAESAEEVKVGKGLSSGKQADQKTEAGAGDSLNRETPPCNSSTTSTSCTAFETKVKLISQNLKETTLAETSASASASCSASASTSRSLVELEPQSHNNSSSSTEDSVSRVKKVRFHPDAKENDGGNWEKEKRRGAQTKRASSPSSMDLDGEADQQTEEYDDEDEVEEEDEPEEKFDLAKTIAEADDFLREHPLTFMNRVVRESQQNGEQPCNGFLSVDQLTMVKDELRYYVNEPEDKDEDFYKRIKPENGIERVLGKETKAGKESTSIDLLQDFI